MTKRTLEQRLFPSFGEDFFGEISPARKRVSDNVNDHIFKKELIQYISWHEKNVGFYEGYEKDKKSIPRLRFLKYALITCGVFFAAFIVNPNFTSPRSLYMRRINYLIFGSYGWGIGYKYQNRHHLEMVLKMYDYFPLPVREALRSKDSRYLQLFDYQGKENELFDPQTHKAY